MTNRDFCRAVGIIEMYGRKVLVDDNYSDQELKELVSVLSALFEEASWK